MFELSIAAKLTLALAVPTTFVLLYWLFRQDEDDDYNSNERVTTSRQTVINIKVPKRCVGTVIGRQGGNIKKIQEKSGARVHFREENILNTNEAEERSVTIRGTSESAQEAELLIRQIIADMADPVTEQITVPGYTLGRIIGRSGETIRQLQRLSQAKIVVERTQESHSRDSPRSVTITGSQQAIDHAKNLIAEHVQDEEAYRARAALKGEKRDQHSSAKKQEQHKLEAMTSVSLPDESWDSQQKCDWSDKDFIKVYVSAVEHPGHFWVQILNEKALQLDKVTDELTAFYNTSEATENFEVPDATLGDIVAAPFELDKEWYRARVMAFDGDQVDLFYIDFGDSCWIDRKMLRKLRPDFLSLPFQAVECKLSNIKPKGEEWSDEAIDVFENLTFCAHWKVLMAKPVRYETKGEEMVPCLRLYDTNSSEDIDINAELINRGFAEEDVVQMKSEESLEVAQNRECQSVAANPVKLHESDVT